MNTRKLQEQADRIEWVLQQYKAPARVTGGRVTPSTIQFHVSPAATTQVKQVQKLSEEIAMALGTTHARVTRVENHINIEVPRRAAPRVSFLRLARQMSEDPQLAQALQVPGTTLLGLAADGVPLMIRLASPDVTHVLVSGTTGSGKTEALKTMLASLVLFQKPREIQLSLIDPKAATFQFLCDTPHLLGGLVTSTEGALSRMRWLESEMERRQNENVARPRLVVVVDELTDLLMQGGREMQVHLTRLAQRGRSAGISIIACTQKPSATVLGGALKANFPVRLVGKVTSSDDARVSAGTAGTGAEKLAGRGDFILVAGGERVRFQAAYLAPEELGEFRAQLQVSLSGRQEKPSGLNRLGNRLKRIR
jgi:DNA segregation ATPase FtsK/SpoIIIE, S-DNA-T family